MPYGVKTDHKIVPFGDNRMVLFETDSGARIVSAKRTSSDAFWVIHVESTPTSDDVKKDSRREAITTMMELALNKLGGQGYSTTVPHGLLELP